MKKLKMINNIRWQYYKIIIFFKNKKRKKKNFIY